MSNQICRFFIKNKCSNGDKCTFIHEKNICRNYFFDGKCDRGDSCKFIHNNNISNNTNNTNNTKIKSNYNSTKSNDNTINTNNSKSNYNSTKSIDKYNKNKRNPKNTTDFTPNHKPLDMNILVDKSLIEYKENDLVIVPNFIKEEYTNQIYNQLLNEMDSLDIEDNKLWLEWHGDNHLIADDGLNWKKNVSTFNLIISEIEKYFHMKVKSTRFNLYENSNDWKPYHHDAAAIKQHIAEVQNFTVGISFGATRDIAFQHSKTNSSISIPLDNCTAYAFSKKINVDWKHGVPQVEPNKAFKEGRISIIAWGKVNLEE
jgi:hypothetical protein